MDMMLLGKQMVRGGAGVSVPVSPMWLQAGIIYQFFFKTSSYNVNLLISKI